MKLNDLILLLLVILVSTACQSGDDVSKRGAAPAASADQIAKGNEAAPVVNVADLKSQQDDLESQKAKLESQLRGLESQKATFAQNKDGTNADAMADGAQALPVNIDQAKVDKIVQAAQDLDVDGVQDAVEDLIADIQDAVADLQDQIDDLVAAIDAAKA